MEQEPLKDKYYQGFDVHDKDMGVSVRVHKPFGGAWFDYQDVKSAVEWLKKELSDLWNNSDSLVLSEILDVVNEAFQDVIEEESENETKN